MEEYKPKVKYEQVCGVAIHEYGAGGNAWALAIVCADSEHIKKYFRFDKVDREDFIGFFPESELKKLKSGYSGIVIEKAIKKIKDLNVEY